ncbi:MAG: hypothetical protein IJX51_08060 [Clostridia bacterium]|nr:hypothetical protein [Clostridia bacterium]
MKKIISMALVVLMLVGSMLTLVACAGIPSDYKDAKANLEDKDYEVEVQTNDTVINATLAMLFGADEVNADALIEAENEDEDGIILVYCEDSDSAKALEDTYSEFVEETLDALEEYYGKDSDEYAEAAEELEKMEHGVSGKVFYFGTEQAIKDVK